MAQFLSVRYESVLNEGSRIQWWCLFHYQNNTVSEKKSAGPRLGSRGYPRKVTLRRMAQIISVRYESALNQGSRIQRFSDTVLFWEWNRPHHWIRLPWFSGLSYLTLVNWAILPKVTFAGYPRDTSWGPANVILDTAGIWGWNSWGHWIQQPCFSAILYPTLKF